MDTAASVPKCFGSEVSWVQSVLTLTNYHIGQHQTTSDHACIILVLVLMLWLGKQRE